jgi:hypothetical protein
MLDWFSQPWWVRLCGSIALPCLALAFAVWTLRPRGRN